MPPLSRPGCDAARSVASLIGDLNELALGTIPVLQRHRRTLRRARENT